MYIVHLHIHVHVLNVHTCACACTCKLYVYMQAASPGFSIKLTPAVEDSSQLVGRSSHHQKEPSVPSFSLKIPTAHLKRISPSFGRAAEGESSLTGTASPESVISASEWKSFTCSYVNSSHGC